ncbi:hypothetical protein M3O75_08685 [Klebsiella pneumoniae]|nr:hypothetical protein [Klebsiella pneumoniae]
MLLHQIGKTQQDAFTVSRGAPGPAAIDKARQADITARSTSAGLASAVVAIACPVAGSQTVNRFSLCAAQGRRRYTGHADGLKLLDAGKQRYL